MKDVFGKALLDFYHNNYTEDLVTWTSISDKDTLPLPYLFRNFDEMPKIEQTALKTSHGEILDVGCGAGNHSLWLQENNIKVKAIDTSPGAVRVSKKRGVLHVEQRVLLDETETFDTILILMNGTGIFQEVKQLEKYLKHLKTLLNQNGQILIDSSDIKYMYSDDNIIETEALNLLNDGNYYGELDYFLRYKGETETPLKWLYLDFETLRQTCVSIGLNCDKVMDGNHFDYLARLSIESE